MDEPAHASAAEVVGLYERHAHAFARDREMGSWPDRIWHRRLAAMLSPGACVLDLGCGPGAPVAQFLAARGLHVTGVDAAPTMIALARERLPACEWIVADMRDLALGRRFDALLAWDSFFHLPRCDQRQMFPIFADHLAPSGLLLFNAGPTDGEAIGSYRGEPLHHASLAAHEYRGLLAEAGFEVIAHAAEDQAAGGRTVWLARRLA